MLAGKGVINSAMQTSEKIPQGEIRRRVQNFQSLLAQENLDGAMILQNVDIYYFSGTIQPSMLFIPVEGSPILMVLKNYSRARQESYLDTVVAVQKKNQVPGIIQDLGFGKLAALGLEMDVVPAFLYLWLQDNFPGCHLMDVSKAIRRQRMLKSTYEIDQIKKTAPILDKGYAHLKEIMAVGITELEIDGNLALLARRHGHMGILRMRGWNQEMTYAHVLSGDSGAVVSFLNSPHGGSGTTAAMAQGAGYRRIQENEPIGIDYGVGVSGYVGDQFRTFVIGRLPNELEKAHACAVEILALLADAAQPGMSCSDLYQLAHGKAVGAGLGDFFMGTAEGQVAFIGHGLGLEIDELPIIGPRSTEKLQPGMVVALEPKFVFPGKGVVGLEDDYVMTTGGLERITLTEQTLIRVGV